uniref:Dr1-associated corepressor n=1 Tax=Gallus gallus TaxID=9031 RepID=A0A8V0X4V6_CHICK
MPSKKKKYNARFPPARIKKIMQTDEEIGKVAAAVPVIISRALELFLESLLRKACHVTQSRNAKTMTTSHLKQCIELEQQFDFLKDLVAAVPDMQGEGDEPHGEGERAPRRGRRPGTGRKNGGPGAKGKDPKQSGTDTEQEEDSEDSDTDVEEETSNPPPARPPLNFTRCSMGTAGSLFEPCSALRPSGTPPGSEAPSSWRGPPPGPGAPPPSQRRRRRMKTTTLSVPPPPPPTFQILGQFGPILGNLTSTEREDSTETPPSPSLPPKHSVCVSGGTTVPSLYALSPFFLGGGRGEVGGWLLGAVADF